MHHRTAIDNRLGTSLLLALALHLVLVLGIGAVHVRTTPHAPSLDVTLALQRSDQAVPDADFLAQFDQRGSGSRQDAIDPTVAVAGLLDTDAVRTITLPLPATPAAAESLPLLGAHDSDEAIPARQADAPDHDAPLPAQASSPPQPPNEIATLRARLDARRQAYARMPRIERLTSAATRGSDDAAYLFAWKQRIEAIGNEHYPVEARRRRLYGDLRLLVALRPDGSVAETRVLHSSGHELLDNAAVQIVRLAAPFDSFPPAIAARVDRLEIIRTWQFRSNRLKASE